MNELAEYDHCRQQVDRLDASIWQTAVLLQVGSVAGLAAIATQAMRYPGHLYPVALLGAVLSVNASLIWWRFANRWWSIQHTLLARMRQLEPSIGFDAATGVIRRDNEAQRYFRGLQVARLPYFAQFWYVVSHQVPSHVSPSSARENPEHEYRGIKPASALLALTVSLAWVFLVLLLTWKASLWVPLLITSAAVAALDIVFLRRK